MADRKRHKWDHPGLEYSCIDPLEGILPKEDQIRCMVNVRVQNRESVDSPLGRLGFTPLTLATGKGHARLVEELLTISADVNCPDASPTRHTPLFIAAREHQLFVMTLLLSAGAEVNKSVKSGDTALSCAACNGTSQSFPSYLHMQESAVDDYSCESSGNEQIARNLIESFADVNHRIILHS